MQSFSHLKINYYDYDEVCKRMYDYVRRYDNDYINKINMYDISQVCKILELTEEVKNG